MVTTKLIRHASPIQPSIDTDLLNWLTALNRREYARVFEREKLQSIDSLALLDISDFDRMHLPNDLRNAIVDRFADDQHKSIFIAHF
jgi:hypothetical protein